MQTGAEYIVNTLSNAPIVSTSLGVCESEEVADNGGGPTDATSEAYLMQQAVRQGLAEGQTWFAAAGDTGADDCSDSSSGTGNGFGGGNATVDFPCSMPEIVCVGGTMFNGAGKWSASGSLDGYVPEVVCNEGIEGVVAGGGQSTLYAKPTWQQGVGPEAGDDRRDLPDVALVAALSAPGVVDFDCGKGQDACEDAGTTIAGIDIAGGTSVAAPLAAGIFAHLAGDLGCSLGDIHATIYQLGAAQQKNGAGPFHDITRGDNSAIDPANKTIHGFSAGPGYDLASGWGSFDVTRLIEAWPTSGSCHAPNLPLGGGGAAGAGAVGGGGGSGAHGAESGSSAASHKGCSCAVDTGRASEGWVGGGLVLASVAGRRRRRPAHTRRPGASALRGAGTRKMT